MNQKRWKTVNQIFHAALEFPSGERQSFVQAASGGDPDIQAEVEVLLKADEAAGSYLEFPIVGRDLFADSLPPVNPEDVLCQRFRIVRAVGEGGMGHVYEAFDAELAVRVALKVIRPEISADPEALARFRQEVRLARRITHPHVCRTFDLERELRVDEQGVTRSLVFLTMEFLEGETLAAKIARLGPLPLDEARETAGQVADALEAAHGLGIVHRDMKPANIMLVPVEADEGRGFRAVIMDFGLARLDTLITAGRGSALSNAVRPVGTLAYMAPEQLQSAPVSAATDVYAFGLILFEMVTGQRAYPSDNFVNGIAKRLTGSAPDPRLLVPSLPEPWERAIHGCLCTKPEERFKSVADTIAVLNGAKLRLRAQPWIVIASAVVMLALLVAAVLNDRLHQSRRLSEKDTVVLADFSNSTGEGIFDDALKTALMVSLNQSPFLNVLPETKVSDTIKLMARPANTQLTPELAREVCQRAGSKAYIAGSIAELGSQYVLGLKAVNCQSGELLAYEQVAANGKERVLDALGRAVSKMRRELGESLGSVQEYDVPLADATTSSLEALKALSLGRKAYQHDTGVALQYFQKASEIDPNFAMAYHDLGRLYFTLDEMEKGRANFARAFALRDHSSEREKLEITATYYENVSGELEKALYTRRQQVADYPHDSESYDGLGYVCSLLGKYDTAIDMLRQSIRLNPDNPDTYGLLGNSLLAVQQLDESRTTIQQAQSQKIDGLLLHTALYDFAFLKADASIMTHEERWMEDQPQYENFGYSLASDSEAYIGHLQKATQLTAAAAVSSNRADSKETAAIWHENAALREAAFGNPDEAKRAIARGLKLHPKSLGVRVEAALAYAIAGDNNHAEWMANSLNEDLPLDAQVQFLWLPAIRAQVALNLKQPSSAIEKLRSVAPPSELGQYPFNIYGSCMFTNYIRGEAYQAEGKGNLAADEFQKILDHGGLVGNCWTGALAYLGLARANALEANTSSGGDAGAARARALSAYVHFLTLWKDADAHIPVLDDAKSKYVKLTSQISP
jgi:eukaryotic-like serine/threonine-protein kinase